MLQIGGILLLLGLKERAFLAWLRFSSSINFLKFF